MGEKKKRFLSILLAFIMIGTMIPVQVYAQKTGTEVKKFNNIVLFVQFAEITPEDPGTNFMNTVPESYANTTYQKDALSFWSNDSSTPKTLKNYLNAVSYGQFEVNNVLPQYDAATGVITPYVVDPSLQTNEIGLIQACMGQLQSQIAADAYLDGNGDGYIDNVTFVPYIADEASRGEDMYPHKADYPGSLLVNEKSLGAYNMIDSYHVFEDPNMRIGVVCHEFMHSLGFPDLYKESGNDHPVDVWDLMATTSTFLQFPLAYLRSSIGGWLTFEEVSEAGTRTLVPATSAEGDQAYILKSPLSSTEFFVVEYRQKGTAMDGLEYKLPGSGMIIYRVNTKIA